MASDNPYAADQLDLLLHLESLLARLGDVRAEVVPGPALVDLLEGRVSNVPVGPLLTITRSANDVHRDEATLLVEEFHRTAASLVSIVTRGSAAKSVRFTLASAYARPPVHLLVLVLILLILIAGPVAGEKLPPEIQTLLSTEVGTVSLGLAIIQWMNQKKKK